MQQYRARYNRVLVWVQRDLDKELITEERARETLCRFLYAMISDRVPNYMLHGDLNGDVSFKVNSPSRDASFKRDQSTALIALAKHHRLDYDKAAAKSRKILLPISALADPFNRRHRDALRNLPCFG